MIEQIRTERHIWDRHAGKFVATGEVMNGDAAELGRLAGTLSGTAGLYLKGPVPWEWIVAAAKLPGHALIVGLCVWRLAGAMKSETVMLGNADLEALGVDRTGKSRALAALEGAGLIKVARRPGRCPLVTLLSCTVARVRQEKPARQEKAK